MLHKLATCALILGACIFLCLGCTDSDDSAAMADSISGGSGDLLLAGIAPVPAPLNTPVDVELDFVSAAAPETADGNSALSFAVKCEQSGNQTLTMTDPKNPENASVDLGFCQLDVSPVICNAKTVGSDKCKANGGYCVNLLDEGGKMMAAFKVGETGSMGLTCSSKVTSYKPMLNFSGENPDGDKLDRFMIYPKDLKPGDTYEPLLAVEYRHAPDSTEHQIDAPDGYTYTYAFHGGTLRVYPQEALAELADQVAADTRAAAKGGGGALGIGSSTCGTSGSSSGGG
jgi:hypothetical protein